MSISRSCSVDPRARNTNPKSHQQAQKVVGSPSGASSPPNSRFRLASPPAVFTGDGKDKEKSVFSSPTSTPSVSFVKGAAAQSNQNGFNGVLDTVAQQTVSNMFQFIHS